MTQELLLFWIGIAAATLGFYFYLKDVFSGTAKPHLFTWLIWAVMGYIGFGIQITNEGGLGSYIMLYFAVIPSIVVFYALKNGTKNIAKIDYLFLALAGVALIFWLLLDLAYISVILLFAIDLMAFIPTFRKSYLEPYSETIALYVLVNVGYPISVLTFDSINFENSFYPMGIFVLNIIFISFLIIRRKQITQS